MTSHPHSDPPLPGLHGSGRLTSTCRCISKHHDSGLRYRDVHLCGDRPACHETIQDRDNIEGGTVMLQETIGIMFDSRMYRGIATGRTGQESLANYEQAAACYGLTPCFLRLEDVDSDTKTCIAYVKKRAYTFVRGCHCLPLFITVLSSFAVRNSSR